MSSKNNIPAIRFKGFSGEWKIQKLEEIASVINQKITSNEINNYLSTENILQDFMGAEFDNVYKPISATHYSEGDILFSNIRPYLKKVYLADRCGGCSNDVIVFRNNYKITSLYLYFSIANDVFTDYVMQGAKGVKMPRGDKDQMLLYPITYPSIAEQQQIGNYFQNIDHLITQSTKRLEKLKNLKKAYLEKMFPRGGATTPELRFKGFSEEWEEISIGNIFKVTRGYVLAATLTSSKKTDAFKYPVYSSQTKDNGLMGYYTDYLYSDAITWTTDGANAGTVSFREGKFYCTNVCGVLLSEDGYANKMVAEALNMIAYKYVSKVGNPKLMNNIMSEIKIILPKDINEQQKIGNFFLNIDEQIAKQTEKLDKLKNIKKACLDKMFV